MTDGAPLRVLARLDRDTDAAWWVRQVVCRGPGLEAEPMYVRWPLAPNVLPVFVPAHRLIPVVGDYHRNNGDAKALAEIYAARDRAAQGAEAT